jgi:hypothetical protein
MKFHPVRSQPMSQRTRALTSLSGRAPSDVRKFSDLSRVARLSLFLGLTALGGPGCLVTTSPDFQQPKQTVPVLSGLSLEPYAVHQLKLNAGTNMYPIVPLSFYVVSEDLAGPSPLGFLLENFRGFGQGKNTKLGGGTIRVPLGHLDSPPRRVDFPFQFDMDPTKSNCRSATLVMTHEFEDPGADILKPVNPDDVASVTWWFSLGDVDPALSSCFVVGASTGDGGIEAAAGSDSGGP